MLKCETLSAILALTELLSVGARLPTILPIPLRPDVSAPRSPKREEAGAVAGAVARAAGAASAVSAACAAAVGVVAAGVASSAARRMPGLRPERRFLYLTFGFFELYRYPVPLGYE